MDEFLTDNATATRIGNFVMVLSKCQLIVVDGAFVRRFLCFFDDCDLFSLDLIWEH